MSSLPIHVLLGVPGRGFAAGAGYTDRLGDSLSLLGGVSDLALGNTNAILYWLLANQSGHKQKQNPRDRGRDWDAVRFTYGLEETGGQVLVNGEVTLLLHSQTGLDRGTLNRIRRISKPTKDGYGPRVRHREELTVAALKAAAMGRPRASLNMMNRGVERRGGERERERESV